MKIAWKALLTGAVGVGAITFTAIGTRPPRLIWNASASVPIGLYRVHPDARPEVADLVVVRPPEALAWFLAKGGYLPRNVRLLKRIAALPGQQVCRTGTAITVDGVPFGDALARDRRGRALPVWQGCTTLTNDQVFLMNPERRDSLDGRYFGPVPRESIVGQASPIWTEEDR